MAFARRHPFNYDAGCRLKMPLYLDVWSRNQLRQLACIVQRVTQISFAPEVQPDLPVNE